MTTTLRVEETTYNEHGYTYTGYRVSGYLNGKRIRIRCKDKAHAQMVLVREQTKGINAARSLEYLPTHLSKAQLDECEAVLEKLGNRATVTDLYDFWKLHHATAGEQISITEAVRRYLNHQESRVRAVTWERAKQSLNKFVAAVEGESPVAEVTHKVVVEYLDSLRGKGGVEAASAKYWNNTKIVLGGFLNWCADRAQGYVSHNVCADIEAKHIEERDIQVLTADETGKLMEHVATLEGGKYARHFAIAVFAGIRPEGELSQLQESDIDLEHGTIKVRAAISKTKKTRHVTIQPNLRSWLEKYAEQPLVISEHAYRKIKADYAKAHDVLRHSFCSYHLKLSGTFEETSQEAGNSEAILKKHYVNRVTKSEATKFWAIVPPQNRQA